MEYDLVGIGFGPANISLAIALDEIGWHGSMHFIERCDEPGWQPGMLLDGTDIQHHPLRDLVTPRNPQSKYGFLSFLSAQGRMFEFLNLGIPFALRKDYAAYIRWVARQFDRVVSYSQEVVDILVVPGGRRPGEGLRFEVRTRDGKSVRARALSFAPGRTPLVPDVFAPHLGDRVVHFTQYLGALSRWKQAGEMRSIAVVGASQSAIEIVLDLKRQLPTTEIHNIQRGFSYQLKDTSPFTEHAYFPQFVDYFFQMSEKQQRAMSSSIRRSNYGAADHDVIHQLYLAMYEQKLDGQPTIRLHTNQNVDRVTTDGSRSIVLDLIEQNHGDRTALNVDAVILATGFRNFGSGEEQELFPPLLSKLVPYARRRESGSLSISRDYRLETEADCRLPPIFINGLCESTHGLGDAGSFSLLALRSWKIATSLIDMLGVESGRPLARVDRDTQSVAARWG
jgi:L-ornithine N5-oxygenase